MTENRKGRRNFSSMFSQLRVHAPYWIVKKHFFSVIANQGNDTAAFWEKASECWQNCLFEWTPLTDPVLQMLRPDMLSVNEITKCFFHRASHCHHFCYCSEWKSSMSYIASMLLKLYVLKLCVSLALVFYWHNNLSATLLHFFRVN